MLLRVPDELFYWICIKIKLIVLNTPTYFHRVYHLPKTIHQKISKSATPTQDMVLTFHYLHQQLIITIRKQRPMLISHQHINGKALIIKMQFSKVFWMNTHSSTHTHTEWFKRGMCNLYCIGIRAAKILQRSRYFVILIHLVCRCAGCICHLEFIVSSISVWKKHWRKWVFKLNITQHMNRQRPGVSVFFMTDYECFISLIYLNCCGKAIFRRSVCFSTTPLLNKSMRLCRSFV